MIANSVPQHKWERAGAGRAPGGARCAARRGSGGELRRAGAAGAGAAVWAEKKTRFLNPRAEPSYTKHYRAAREYASCFSKLLLLFNVPKL